LKKLNYYKKLKMNKEVKENYLTCKYCGGKAVIEGT